VSIHLEHIFIAQINFAKTIASTERKKERKKKEKTKESDI
jgi:hypothetical protein